MCFNFFVFYFTFFDGPLNVEKKRSQSKTYNLGIWVGFCVKWDKNFLSEEIILLRYFGGGLNNTFVEMEIFVGGGISKIFI